MSNWLLFFSPRTVSRLRGLGCVTQPAAVIRPFFHPRSGRGCRPGVIPVTLVILDHMLAIRLWVSGDSRKELANLTALKPSEDCFCRAPDFAMDLFSSVWYTQSFLAFFSPP